MIRVADYVIAISAQLKNEMIAAGVPADRITVLCNAVLLEDYAVRGSGTGLRRELGIPDHHAVLSIIGRLSPEKGHDVFLDAAQILAGRHADLTFLIVGDGPLRAHLEAESSRGHLRGRIVFAGHRTDMAAVYDATTVVVSSSFTEGLPNVLLESFAHRRPAVATRVGGVPEIMSNGVEGWLVEAGRPQDLADRLDAMLRSPTAIAAMGDRARHAIETRFDFRLRTQNLEALYERVMADRSQPVRA